MSAKEADHLGNADAAKIARAIKARRLTQQGSAELLGVDQSKCRAGKIELQFA